MERRIVNNYVFGRRSKENLKGVNPIMVKVEDALRYSTVDFSVIDGLRTTQEQQELYKAGVTELDGLVKKSAHQSGNAVDVIPYVEDMDIWDVNSPEVSKLWLEVGRAMLRSAMKNGVCLEWGVAYNIGGGRDYPHFELK